MTPGQSPAEITARVLERLPPLIRQIRPDVLLVQGDTMTSFAAAFAAYLDKVPSGHVEAGLRTGDRYQPFPGGDEPGAHHPAGVAALRARPRRPATACSRRACRPADVHLTGNTVIDALAPDRPARLPLPHAGAGRARSARAAWCS